MYRYNQIVFKEYATVRNTVRNNRLTLCKMGYLSFDCMCILLCKWKLVSNSNILVFLYGNLSIAQHTLCLSSFCLKYFCGSLYFSLQWLSYFYSVPLLTRCLEVTFCLEVNRSPSLFLYNCETWLWLKLGFDCKQG